MYAVVRTEIYGELLEVEIAVVHECVITRERLTYSQPQQTHRRSQEFVLGGQPRRRDRDVEGEGYGEGRPSPAD